MSNWEQQYLNLLEFTLNNGDWSDNRTGIKTISIPSATLMHNMTKGFPLLTVRKVPYKSTRVELEGFIKGISSKKWYQERGCKYWNQWANPKKVPYNNDEETKRKMLEEDDLGIIYGNNWRKFHDPEFYKFADDVIDYDVGFNFRQIDQFKNIIEILKSNPNDRRMLCLAWNPLALEYASLPACHFGFQILVIDNKLHLNYFQRSTDAVLGTPANFSSYATLLHLFAKESGFEEGQLTAFMSSFHIYENQIEGVNQMLNRIRLKPPTIKTDKFTSIFDWEHQDTELIGYEYNGSIKFEVAV